MSESEDPLEDLYEEAESKREQFSEAQQRLREIKTELRDVVDELESDIGPGEADRLRKLIDRGQYGQVREAIKQAREGHSVQLVFDDEEKQQFADAFAEEWLRLETIVENIRNEVLKFDPYDREEMIAVLYGKHSSLNKGDIKATLQAIDDVSATSINRDSIARILSAFNRELNITTAREVLEAIEEEAE